MKLESDFIIQQFDAHCKSKFPREFAKKLKKGFDRNNRVNSAEELYNLSKFYGFEDCYSSVYPFNEWDAKSEIRKQSAIIDTLPFDLDSTDLNKSFKECRKLVKFLQGKGTTPRIYFSGAKGFHIYIDFPPVELQHSAAIKRLGIQLSERLKLKTYDQKIWELSRVIRLPFTINTKTGYRCTPLSLDLLFKLDLNSLIHFCKYNHSDIQVNEDVSFPKLLKFEDFRLSSSKTIKKSRSRTRKWKGRGQDKKWINKRINHYIQALRDYGRLTSDPSIAKKHGNDSGSEHNARVHLNCLMIEAGYSDEEIMEVFKVSDDVNEQIIEYQVRYNRRWCKENRRGVETWA